MNIKKIIRGRDVGTEEGRAWGVENQRSSRKHKKLDREDKYYYYFWSILIESAS